MKSGVSLKMKDNQPPSMSILGKIKSLIYRIPFLRTRATGTKYQEPISLFGPKESNMALHKHAPKKAKKPKKKKTVKKNKGKKKR